MAIASILIAFGCIVGAAVASIALLRFAVAQHWLGVVCASILLVGCIVGLAQAVAQIEVAYHG